jgi:hypothetical protein
MANSSKRRRRLWDTYTFPGFRPQPTVRGIFGDPKARLITLARRAKKRPAGAVGGFIWVGTTGVPVASGRSLRGFTRRQYQTHDGSLVAALPFDLAAELSRKGIDQPAAKPGILASRIDPLAVIGDDQAKLSRKAL